MVSDSTMLSVCYHILYSQLAIFSIQLINKNYTSIRPLKGYIIKAVTYHAPKSDNTKTSAVLSHMLLTADSLLYSSLVQNFKCFLSLNVTYAGIQDVLF